jgi:hypothetical protein
MGAGHAAGDFPAPKRARRRGDSTAATGEVRTTPPARSGRQRSPGTAPGGPAPAGSLGSVSNSAGIVSPFRAAGPGPGLPRAAARRECGVGVPTRLIRAPPVVQLQYGGSSEGPHWCLNFEADVSQFRHRCRNGLKLGADPAPISGSAGERSLRILPRMSRCDLEKTVSFERSTKN